MTTGIEQAEITFEQAQKIVVETRNERLRLAERDLQELLKRHNCALEAVPVYRRTAGGGFVTDIAINLIASND